jgi:hypothetical protein
MLLRRARALGVPHALILSYALWAHGSSAASTVYQNTTTEDVDKAARMLAGLPPREPPVGTTAEPAAPYSYMVAPSFERSMPAHGHGRLKTMMSLHLWAMFDARPPSVTDASLKERLLWVLTRRLAKESAPPATGVTAYLKQIGSEAMRPALLSASAAALAIAAAAPPQRLPGGAAANPLQMALRGAGPFERTYPLLATAAGGAVAVAAVHLGASFFRASKHAAYRASLASSCVVMLAAFAHTRHDLLPFFWLATVLFFLTQRILSRALTRLLNGASIPHPLTRTRAQDTTRWTRPRASAPTTRGGRTSCTARRTRCARCKWRSSQRTSPNSPPRTQAPSQ